MVSELRFGSARALIDPNRGGRLVSLEVAGREFIADAGPRVGEPDWYGGSFLLAPWAGRSKAGTHGLVFGETWQTRAQDECSVTLSIEVDHEQWRGMVEQRFVLASQQLEVRASARPSGVLPTAMGFHPWFPREADGELPMIEAEFTHRIGADGASLDVAKYGNGTSPRDEVYQGALAAPVLRWRDGRRMMVESSAPVWVVYEADSLGICVEPWTATPGEYDSAQCLASPDHPAELVMRLRW